MKIVEGSVADKVLKKLPGQAMREHISLLWQRRLDVTVTPDESGNLKANLFFTVPGGAGSSGRSYKDRLTGIEEGIRRCSLPNKEHWKVGFLEPDAEEIEAFRENDHILGNHEADFIDNTPRASVISQEEAEKLRNDYPLVLKISVDLDPISDNQHFKALMAFLAPKEGFVISPSEARKIISFVHEASAERPQAPTLEHVSEDTPALDTVK